MKRKQIKFVVGSLVVVLALGYLAITGFQESKSYYQTVSELYASKEAAYGRRLRVAGDVVPNSIVRDGKSLKFVISQESQTLPVEYVGTDPVPDTFRDRAQAVVEGTYGQDGVFVAKNIQAKCASKYEKEAAAGVNTSKAEY